MNAPILRPEAATPDPAGATPVMAQYFEAKARQPDALGFLVYDHTVYTTYAVRPGGGDWREAGVPAGVPGAVRTVLFGTGV